MALPPYRELPLPVQGHPDLLMFPLEGALYTYEGYWLENQRLFGKLGCPVVPLALPAGAYPLDLWFDGLPLCGRPEHSGGGRSTGRSLFQNRTGRDSAAGLRPGLFGRSLGSCGTGGSFFRRPVYPSAGGGNFFLSRQPELSHSLPFARQTGGQRRAGCFVLSGTRAQGLIKKGPQKRLPENERHTGTPIKNLWGCKTSRFFTAPFLRCLFYASGWNVQIFNRILLTFL